MRSSAGLAALMVASVALVTALSFWDETREGAASLASLGPEQARIAASVAAVLDARLEIARRDAARIAEDLGEGRPVSADVLASYAMVSVVDAPRSGLGDTRPAVRPESPFDLDVPVSGGREVHLRLRPDALLGTRLSARPSALFAQDDPTTTVLLVRAHGSALVRASDGQTVHAEGIASALDGAASFLRLTRGEAFALGLPERMAFAGLAHVDAADLGRWGIAVVTTAQRERDREDRGRWRLVLGVTLVGGLVLVFGGIAVAKQRAELELEHRLAVVTLREEKDERLERATKVAVLGTLATGIAHEVSTPLGVIVGRAEQVLAHVEGDERQRHAMQTILDQAERIHQVVRGFLGLARGGSPAFDEYTPRAIVVELEELVAHRLERASLRLVTRVPAGLPPISCDFRLLCQALVNLLLNACDASKPGDEVVLEVSADDRGVAFVVSDEGSGIREEDAARVTEPFFTTKADGKGTGLGLAIASEIVAMHRGTLALSPRKSRGTQAVLRIPVKAPKPPEGSHDIG